MVRPDAPQRPEPGRGRRREEPMTTAWFTLKLFHLLGMALMLGAAASKIALLAASLRDPAFSPAYPRVARTLTRLLVSGLVLATLSGAAWLVLGRPVTPALWAKLGLAAALWGVGPVIDKVVEPHFARLAVDPALASSPEAVRRGRQYLAVEALATALACA